MRYVLGLSTAWALLLSSACTNAVPVTSLSSLGDNLESGKGPSANLTSASGQVVSSNFRLNYRLGKTTTEQTLTSSGSSYKLRLTRSELK